jgi:NAD+ synthase (glutamine-hydrolysing)
MMLVTLAQLNPIVGNFKFNYQQIIEAIESAKNDKSDLIITNELALTGYPPLDLLHEQSFMEYVEYYVEKIKKNTQGICLILGLPRKNKEEREKKFHNSLYVISNQEIIGIYDKQLLPTYDVFDEKRYFEPGKENYIFILKNKKIALTICEDMWQHAHLTDDTTYFSDPIDQLKNENIDLFINVSASPYSFNKHKVRENILKKVTSTLNCFSIFCNQTGANDGLIFDGNSMVMSKNQQLIYKAKSFTESVKTLAIFQDDTTNEGLVEDPYEELYKGLVKGVKDYYHKSGFKKAIIGLSGGIDSALAALIAKDALGKENVLTFFMPSRFSSKSSFDDAELMAKNLDVYFKVISIEPIFEAYQTLLKDIKNETVQENLQARIRSMILMAMSNETSALLLNTSNKSELAMGYSTLYGDSCGALSPLGDLYKTQVFELSKLKDVIPKSIISKPPSAELKFDQKDTDSLPEYDILDAILKSFIEDKKSEEEIAKTVNRDISFIKNITRKVFLNEFKRRQAPSILRVSTKGLTPSIGRIVPIVQGFG